MLQAFGITLTPHANLGCQIFFNLFSLFTYWDSKLKLKTVKPFLIPTFFVIDLDKLDTIFSKMKEVYNWTEKTGSFRGIVGHTCSNSLLYAGRANLLPPILLTTNMNIC
jgi:hypothetical protein